VKSPFQVAIGVGGRFHADQMAQALTDAGHSVNLFTSLPTSRFSHLQRIPVHSLILPEVVYRISRQIGLENWGATVKMQRFGKALATALSKLEVPPQLTITWSSFGLETIQKLKTSAHVVVRDSAHIEFQIDVLMREYEKIGLTFPDHQVCLEREMEEYDLAEKILVPSEFAKRTFVARGIPDHKLKVIHLGAALSLFRPLDSADRLQLPLRVIYFGAISVQKGVHYLLEATRAFSPKQLQLTLVGAVEPSFQKFLVEHLPRVQVRPPMPHTALSTFIREHHVFVLPSLHDGFGMVVPQAMASGLVPIVSDHCGAAELVENGVNGYIVPAGDSMSIREKLRILIAHPEQWLKMRFGLSRRSSSLDWKSYAQQIQGWVQTQWIDRRTTAAAA
jgi:glycosyltransferase involved in cell wall biosynthesis